LKNKLINENIINENKTLIFTVILKAELLVKPAPLPKKFT